MSTSESSYAELIDKAKTALRNGDKLTSRRMAEKAILINGDSEEPWLILAAISSPKASINYLNKALEINPSSVRARKGMHWAVNRLRSDPTESSESSLIPPIIRTEETTIKKPAYFIWILGFILVLIGLGIWFGSPVLSKAMAGRGDNPVTRLNITKATRTPTSTPTDQPTITPTFTPTSTATTIPTETSTATATYTATMVPTALPTETPKPKPKAKLKKNKTVATPDFAFLPEGVDQNERWIDVDLSAQRVYALVGSQVERSFLVSTGTWRTPTVTGIFRVYVKYRFADMSGPGYYLPNVPYVMYFYKGYGLHGTYWHNNFGTPMSHGCVNFNTEDAGWIFKFSSVGTIVRVHP